MSGALSDRRLEDRRTEAQEGEGPLTVNVQAAFRGVDAPSAEMLAAEMIARAHELANRPECSCDVDVSVQCVPPAAAVDEC